MAARHCKLDSGHSTPPAVHGAADTVAQNSLATTTQAVVVAVFGKALKECLGHPWHCRTPLGPHPAKLTKNCAGAQQAPHKLHDRGATGVAVDCSKAVNMTLQAMAGTGHLPFPPTICCNEQLDNGMPRHVQSSKYQSGPFTKGIRHH